MLNFIDLSHALVSFTSIFTLINPLGILPIYLTLTESIERDERTIINRKGILTAGIVLIIFSLIGHYIFSFYGITIHAFKIAGGILFFRIGISMIESKISRTKATPQEEKEAHTKDVFAYTPLGIPMIAGPGAITSAVILSGDTSNIQDKVTFILALFVALLFTYGIFQTAGRISKLLGIIGIRIMQRIMGLLLMVIAVQFIIDGTTPILKEIF